MTSAQITLSESDHRNLWIEAGIDYGLCLCGCGEETTITKMTSRAKGLVKGRHSRFLTGHHRRKKSYWVEHDCGYTTPCWVWTAPLTRAGYGRFWRDERMVLAHRWVYEQRVGPIEPTLALDHLCLVKPCVNPAHLEPVTREENTRRHFAAMREERLIHSDRRERGSIDDYIREARGLAPEREREHV